MQIFFTKLSDQEHKVQIIRADNSSEEQILNSRSFLRHDFAHLATEMALNMEDGYWGSVANGADISGKDMSGSGIAMAEKLAVRVQGLMRENADPGDYEKILTAAAKDLIDAKKSAQIFEQARQIQGHWRATAYGDCMQIEWPEQFKTRSQLT